MLEQLKKSESCLVLAFGSTGCGKSTMFTSLIEGSQSLVLAKVEEEKSIPQIDGSVKKVKKMVY